jgi:hypothetical protein
MRWLRVASKLATVAAMAAGMNSITMMVSEMTALARRLMLHPMLPTSLADQDRFGG